MKRELELEGKAIGAAAIATRRSSPGRRLRFGRVALVRWEIRDAIGDAVLLGEREREY